MSVTQSSKFVFCPPQFGKPDPTQEKPIGKDTRRRVIQLGSKGDNCWYVIFNMLRERYKAPNASTFKGRDFEKIASTRRKAIFALNNSLPDIIDKLDNVRIKYYFSSMTRKSFLQFPLDRVLDNLDRYAAQNRKVNIKTYSIIPSFENQNMYDSFYDYLFNIGFIKRFEINENFLKSIGKNPKDLLNAAKRIDPHYEIFTCWEDLSPEQKCSLLDSFVRKLSAEHYGIKISSWLPSQPIENLIDELTHHGPLGVAGSFGWVSYDVPARKLGKKIENRDIYYWRKDDPKKDVGHIILIVGAEKIGINGFVYYIDPNDDSDPAHPETQPIYMMSYKKLTSENLSDTDGFVRLDAPAEIGYAYYRGIKA